MTTETEPPLFDSALKALQFALNATTVDMPRPFMNKAMADAPVRKLSKKVKETLQLRDEETKRMNLYPRAHFKGMEKAAQAGFILRQLDKIDIEQATILRCTLIEPYEPCSCRSPCCMGHRPNARWLAAIQQMCQILKETGDVIMVPGKRGLSTQPRLRQIIVESWCTETPWKIAAIAKQVELSPITVKAHRDWICDYLGQTQTLAWQQIAPILDQVGITGTIL